MQTLIIYLDKTKKNFRIITPFAQGAEFDSKTRFDGNWKKLADHLEGDNYSNFEII